MPYLVPNVHQKYTNKDVTLHHIKIICYLAEAFIQSDLQLIRLSRGQPPLKQCNGPCSSCVDVIVAPSGGDMAQEVRAVVWQLEGCRFDPTLGLLKCPSARHLTPPCMAANRFWGVYERHKLYSALDKGAI